MASAWPKVIYNRRQEQSAAGHRVIQVDKVFVDNDEFSFWS
nr:hypothetical protein [uncultured Desulfobacter sp.]